MSRFAIANALVFILAIPTFAADTDNYCNDKEKAAAVGIDKDREY